MEEDGFGYLDIHCKVLGIITSRFQERFQEKKSAFLNQAYLMISKYRQGRKSRAASCVNFEKLEKEAGMFSSHHWC